MENKFNSVPTTIDANESLVESIEMRENLIGRVDVLEKVKKLFLIPGIEMMTTRQVAEYYDVDIFSINRCFQRNRAEIERDGVKSVKRSDMVEETLTEQDVQLKDGPGKISIIYNGGEAVIPNRGTYAFSKRAVLRIGMLLRDSEIAKEVRTQLLNTLENAGDDIIVKEIITEIEYITEIVKAFAKNDHTGMLLASQALSQYYKRHIIKLEENVSIVTGKNLTTNPRGLVTRLIRAYAAARRHGVFAFAWTDFYKELHYQKGLRLKRRSGYKGNQLDVVKDDEWPALVEVASSMCNNAGLDVVQIANEVNAEEYDLTNA